MEKKYQVFISSTYTDLKEERQKIVESVLSAGHIPAGMELFHAGDETQKELIEEWIVDSDIYVLLLGGRYGSLDNSGISYTHWEYLKAIELGKPSFSLVLSDDYINQKVEEKKVKATDLETQLPKYREFKDEVKNKIISEINSIDQIESEVIKSLHRIEKKESDSLQGWIRGSYLREIEELKIEKDILNEKLLSRQEQVIEMKDEIFKVKDNFIGDFSYEYICDCLSNIYVDLGDIAKSYEANNESGNYREYLKKIEKTNGSLLKLLVEFEGRFLDIVYPTSNLYKDFLDGETINILRRFNLVETTFKESRNGNKKEGFRLSDLGKKYISLLQMPPGK